MIITTLGPPQPRTGRENANAQDRLRMRERRARLRSRLPDMRPPSISFRLRCSGQLHEVTATGRGPVTFHRHPGKELKALEVFEHMGDKLCGCLEVRKWLNGKDEPRKKPEMRDFSKACDTVRWRREELKQERRKWWYEETSNIDKQRLANMRDRRYKDVAKIMNELGSREELCYPGFTDHGPYKAFAPSGQNRIDHGLIVGPSGEPLIYGNMRFDYSKTGAWRPGEFTIECLVPYLWTCWYRNGVGVVEGHIVVDIPGARSTWMLNDRLLVVAGRVVQNELGRHAVRAWLAVIRKEHPHEVKTRTWPTPTLTAPEWRIDKWIAENTEANRVTLVGQQLLGEGRRHGRVQDDWDAGLMRKCVYERPYRGVQPGTATPEVTA